MRLPERTGQPTALQTLQLDDNKLTHSLESIGQLSTLQTLQLRARPRAARGPQFLLVRDDARLALPPGCRQG